MKKLFLILTCAATLLSCKGESEQQQVISPDDIHTAPAGAVKPAEQDATAPLTQLDSIKQEVERINTAGLAYKRHDFMCDEKAYVVYHYDKGSVVKVTIDWGTVGDAYHREEFYYRNGRLIFDYDLVEGAGAYPGGDTKLERRHYVANDKAIRYLENNGEKPCEYCTYTKSSVAYRALAAEVSKDFQGILCR